MARLLNPMDNIKKHFSKILLILFSKDTVKKVLNNFNLDQ